MSHRCRKTSLRIYFQVVFSVYCWLSFELMIVQLDCSCFGFREISLPLTPRSLWLHISCHQPQRDMWCSRWEVKALPGSHTENFCEVGSVLVLKFDIATVQSFPKHCKLIRLIGNLALWKKSWTCCTWMSHPMYRWRISYMGAYAILPLMLTSCIWSLGVKTRVRSLFRLKVVSMRGFHFWCIEKKSPLCPGLTKYVELYPDRLVYDTMQNPEKRARMSTKQGYLQTLTTGVSALWSRRFSRFIRHILGIRFWFDENELDVFIWIYQLYPWALNLTKTEWSYYLLMVFQLNHAQHTSWASSFLTRDHWAIALYAAHLHSGWIGIVHSSFTVFCARTCDCQWLRLYDLPLHILSGKLAGNSMHAAAIGRACVHAIFFCEMGGAGSNTNRP